MRLKGPMAKALEVYDNPNSESRLNMMRYMKIQDEKTNEDGRHQDLEQLHSTSQTRSDNGRARRVEKEIWGKISLSPEFSR